MVCCGSDFEEREITSERDEKNSTAIDHVTLLKPIRLVLFSMICIEEEMSLLRKTMDAATQIYLDDGLQMCMQESASKLSDSPTL